MAADLAAAPVLSTPDDHILEVPAQTEQRSVLSEDALRSTYEVARTAAQIREGGWARVALQFPDSMLVDAPRVVEALGKDFTATGDDARGPRIYVLADTSYSACCVDEIAAEHADADVVVHYGRTCLSPTSRLPVIYVYTRHDLDHDLALARFQEQFPDKQARVVVMADLTYQSHVAEIVRRLVEDGYGHVVGTEVVRDPGGLIPNRRIAGETLPEELLRSHALFHVSDPPASLLLALHSRFASLHGLSTASPSTPALSDPTASTAGLLRRRFARVLSLASAGVVGILVNTLSVSNYLSSVDLLRQKVAAAGKKSYTVVVGKLNPAKLANFAEVEGWVVVGCWESGLVDDDEGYWRPVVTPFELEVALMSEDERVWGGEWWGGIEKLGLHDDDQGKRRGTVGGDADVEARDGGDDRAAAEDMDGDVEGEESLPPVFDLRTGRLVSHSRPMRATPGSSISGAGQAATDNEEGNRQNGNSGALLRKAAGHLASVNGVASPGAEFLRSQRTWQGLGSDFESSEASATIEEGRSGIARGYRVGEETPRR